MPVTYAQDVRKAQHVLLVMPKQSLSTEAVFARHAMANNPRNASIFISYASEQRNFAEALSLRLINMGFKVFFDRDSLVAGREYDLAILSRIRESDLFIFLISPESVSPGRYTLTELKYAKEVWRAPSGKVLPVLAAKTDYEKIPMYLKSVTMIEPEGNLVAEVSAKVNDLVSSWDVEELVINQKKNVRMLQMQQELNNLATKVRGNLGEDPPSSHLSLQRYIRLSRLEAIGANLFLLALMVFGLSPSLHVYISPPNPSDDYHDVKIAYASG
jgi:hypothetical protein